jgi:ubiquinone/menaquinone biosynthesis C-methylase UbiE
MINRKIRTISVFLLALLIIAVSALIAQEKKGVLEPETPNEARLNRLQPPDQVMDAIGIVPGMTVAEIGAGNGRYVVQLAVRVGTEGKVYAEDIDAGALNHLENRCKRWELKNVETILGDVTDPKLPQGELDIIFVISAYHHFEDPITLLRNARSALKSDGKLAIGEWIRATPPKRVETQMNEAGYSLERIEKFLEENNLYIYIFRLDDTQ